MEFDALRYDYPSRRKVVYSKKGMVCTSHYLAAQVGLEIIKRGGNAIDAAIATAACLTVVEPTSNGVGGDAFALVWVKGKLYGLNASGSAPKLISAKKIKTLGHKRIPRFGWVPVTVPGAPAGWIELSNRFGKLPFNELIYPAIQYANEGFPVSPSISYVWNKLFEFYSKALKGEEYKYWFDTFTVANKAPKPSEVWRSKDLAKTLGIIAETKAEGFYRGELADKIDSFSRKYNGFLRGKDLNGYHVKWVKPIKINYRGYDIWEMPPNSQGIIPLMTLNILKGFDFSDKDSLYTIHKQIEAIKLAFEDGMKSITDPINMDISTDWLLSEDYAEQKRKLIKGKAISVQTNQSLGGGTVYLATADSDGNMVSFIQSNYKGFGSGLVVPNTGISLNNRGYGFSLDESEVNCIAPMKKPYHTIIPGFISKKGIPIGPFGLMGGFMQPQGHVQIIMNTIDFKMNPQNAIDAPRWKWTGKNKVDIEYSFHYSLADALERIGHRINLELDHVPFGKGQIIWRTRDDVLVGATEGRADGTVAAI